MKNINSLSKIKAKKFKYILHDIDDTITTDGKLHKNAYSALWDLHDAGYKIIPITGRPAGWCDLIIRQWPVEAVIGENGAFAYYSQNNQVKTYVHPLVKKDISKKLAIVKEDVLKNIKNSRVSKDQFSRLFDLAIDFNEDPPYLGFDVAKNIKEICESYGAIAKISSIHVNTWFGDYNKLSMTKLFFENIMKEKDFNEKSIFFGDSPNDEPMFEYFENSCAVANINSFTDILKHFPTFVTKNVGGEGFFEASQIILNLKKS